jgi:hypothetical protein
VEGSKQMGQRFQDSPGEPLTNDLLGSTAG